MVVDGDLEFLSNFDDLVGAASRNLGASKSRAHMPRLRPHHHPIVKKRKE
jgi:hypothetical protein